ncbi:helix-turn-helix domain-containing protein [Nonomuraea salmonea]|uniref:helix-turn-helix domain-containing protein n=1 Tax=Nonomuraea salmonea TaxID=46181 RepID=UPI00361ED075
MVRPPLTPEDRLRGEQLGQVLRQARGDRSIVEVAAAAGMSAETLRKIETGRIATRVLHDRGAGRRARHLPRPARHPLHARAHRLARFPPDGGTPLP